MSKFKLIFNVTMVSGIILFVLELVAFMLFKDMYKENFGLLLSNQDALMFGSKLLGANMAIGFFISIIFDTVYKSLPGGFLRKGLNFALVLWGLTVLPWVAHFYITIDFTDNFLFLLMIQYLIIDVILGFVLTGLYDEFYLHIKGKELEKAKNESEQGGAEEKPHKETIGEKFKKGWQITLKPKKKEEAVPPEMEDETVDDSVEEEHKEEAESASENNEENDDYDNNKQKD